MRVTNNMIIQNSSYNIGGTKNAVNKGNTQMTTQKKISRPSEDPVIAIRSLRLSSSLNKINQYADKNIPDAKSWLDVTETALINMKDIITDVRTLCVNGSTGTLTEDDRNTIIKQLKELQKQLYSEGNADSAGRTVFTGFRTNKELVFSQNELDTTYDITQSFSGTEIESFDYYTGEVKIPSTVAELGNDISDITKNPHYRLRVAYDSITEAQSLKTEIAGAEENWDIAGATDATVTAADGTNITYKEVTSSPSGTKLYVVESETDWAQLMNGKNLGDEELVFIKSNGNLVLGDTIANDLMSQKGSVTLDYQKKGFVNGELRPEYYFDCTDITDPANPVEHIKFLNGEPVGYDINYTISNNQELTVNTEASNVFNHDMYRDMSEMIDAVGRSIDAHEKLAKIKSMKSSSQCDDPASQAKLEEWQAAVQKEVDNADRNLKALFDSELGKVDGYLGDITLAIANVGCTSEQLALTEARIENQQETIIGLQSKNDDMEISDIIIQYTAAYNAYQSSLTAASKLGQMTLLNYL